MPESKIDHLVGASTGLTGDRPPVRHPPYWFQARRRLFLKHYGFWYTAISDAMFILGFTAWRLRRWIQRKPDHDPPHLLIDSIRHSVFCTGFKVREVENPAMEKTAPLP